MAVQFLDLLSEDETATALRKSPRTLKRWRALREGPPWVRVGGQSVFYRRSSIEKWLDAQEVRP